MPTVPAMLLLYPQSGCSMRKDLMSAMVLATAMLGAAPAGAQDAIEGRVDRLEGEMRAVQRKVFPGGAGQYIQPNNAPAGPAGTVPGTPSSSPVADLTQRVDSLEGQLRTLTGEVETSQHQVQMLEGRIKALEATASALSPSLSSSTSMSTPAPLSGNAPAPIDRPVAARPARMPGEAKATLPPAARGATQGDPARAARLAAVERPETGEAAEDIYLYGYRLWAAKLYPEAETQFTAVTTKFASHKRASYAQNLLGRSYLEDGKPSLASLAFYDNYKKWPDGDRAAESLYYLAQALVKLDKPAAQVCKVYTELMRSYGAKVESDPKMKAGVAKGRAESKCA